MEKSNSIKEIATALCNFQREVTKIKKSETNPFFRSKYADLSSILDVIREPLAKNDLSFTQFPTGENQLTTLLMHTSGEWIQGEYKMTPTKNDPQGLGSVITYQRRYALGAILGLNIDEDDDGNAGSKQPEKIEKPEKIWLTKEQFEKALNSDLKGLKATVTFYNTETHGMKKEYSEKLREKIKSLDHE